jgi:hypothetical protein
MRTGEGTMTRDEFKEAIILDTLRRFVLNSDLSDRRISLLMGIEIETLRALVAGTANPQKQSLNKIRSFLKWHGRKNKTGWPITVGFLPDLCD